MESVSTELPIDLTTKFSEAISTSKLEEHVSETTTKPKVEKDHISEITTKPKLEDHIIETTVKPKLEDHITETTAQPKIEDHISELTTQTLIEKDEVVELTTKGQLISESSIEDKVSTPKSIESSSHLPDKDKVEVTLYDYLTTKLPVEIETEFSKSSEDKKDLTTQLYEQSSTSKPQHISSEAIQKEFEVTTTQSLKTDVKDKVEESEIVTEMPTVILDKLTTIEHIEPIRTTPKAIDVGVETKKLTTGKPEEFTTSKEINKTETSRKSTTSKDLEETTTALYEDKVSPTEKIRSSTTISQKIELGTTDAIGLNEIDVTTQKVKELPSKKHEISSQTTPTYEITTQALPLTHQPTVGQTNLTSETKSMIQSQTPLNETSTSSVEYETTTLSQTEKVDQFKKDMLSTSSHLPTEKEILSSESSVSVNYSTTEKPTSSRIESEATTVLSIESSQETTASEDVTSAIEDKKQTKMSLVTEPIEILSKNESIYNDTTLIPIDNFSVTQSPSTLTSVSSTSIPTTLESESEQLISQKSTVKYHSTSVTSVVDDLTTSSSSHVSKEIDFTTEKTFNEVTTKDYPADVFATILSSTIKPAITFVPFNITTTNLTSEIPESKGSESFTSTVSSTILSTLSSILSFESSTTKSSDLMTESKSTSPIQTSTVLPTTEQTVEIEEGGMLLT